MLEFTLNTYKRGRIPLCEHVIWGNHLAAVKTFVTLLQTTAFDDHHTKRLASTSSSSKEQKLEKGEQVKVEANFLPRLSTMPSEESFFRAAAFLRLLEEPYLVQVSRYYLSKFDSLSAF